ncbi:uncharacterized protein ACB058_010629 isoform 1-T1 [Synchiropus picturatus]
MSESSSGVNTLSAHWSQCSGPTHSRPSAEPSPDSGLTTTPLPSRRFRFASWHGLDQCDVTGDQLSCPRVRAGPCEGVGGAVALEPRTRTGRRPGQPWERRLQENWENCRVSSPAGHVPGAPRHRLTGAFFSGVEPVLPGFGRAIPAGELPAHPPPPDPRGAAAAGEQLPEQPEFCPPAKLPKLPAVQHLCLSENAIGSLAGLGELGSSPLRSLSMAHNPVAFTQDYRARVFSALPKLELLDGIPKLPEDSLPTGPRLPQFTRVCSIL